VGRRPGPPKPGPGENVATLVSRLRGLLGAGSGRRRPGCRGFAVAYDLGSGLLTCRSTSMSPLAGSWRRPRLGVARGREPGLGMASAHRAMELIAGPVSVPGRRAGRPSGPRPGAPNSCRRFQRGRPSCPRRRRAALEAGDPGCRGLAGLRSPAHESRPVRRGPPAALFDAGLYAGLGEAGESRCGRNAGSARPWLATEAWARTRPPETQALHLKPAPR